MTPIKSSIARVLRVKAPSSSQRVLNTAVNRGLTRTANNATISESSTIPQSSFPFRHQGNVTYHLFVPSGTSCLTSTPDHHFQQPYPIQHTQHPAHNNITNAFTQLTDSITASLQSTPKPDLPHLAKLLRAYTSEPEHWSRFAFPDPSRQYTRNLVADVPGLFNLLLLVWTPGKASPVHDHAEAHCLMKVRYSFVLSWLFHVFGFCSSQY
jgi:cysteine dioxygenase